jgi:hypothetical protein
MDVEEVAIASDWSGDAQLFVDTLIEVGLVDRDSSGVLSVHGWAEHQPFAAGFEERSKKAQRAARSRWDAAGDAPGNASGNALGNAPFPLPVPSASGADSRPSSKTPFPPSSAATAASPEEEFKNSPWLISFLKNEQNAFKGDLLGALIHHDFWADVSQACNGINASFLRVEFARMSIWLRDNSRRKPTKIGVRRFVTNWLQKAAEKRRTKAAV